MRSLLIVHTVFMTIGLVASGQDFKYPSIPDSLVTIDARASYMASHYWDYADLGDTCLFSKPDRMLDYIYLLGQGSRDMMRSNIISLLERLAPFEDNLARCQWWFEHFLNDVQSPMYDNELYLTVVEAFIASPIDTLFKMRPCHQLNTLTKNRVGHQAVDFNYFTIDGATYSVSDLMGTWILLVFHRPSCELCRKTLTLIEQSKMIKALIEQQMLTVIAVSLEPDDMEIQCKNIIPVHVNDSFEEDQLYETQQFPSCYLVDPNHTVVLRQTRWETCEDFLKSITTH